MKIIKEFQNFNPNPEKQFPYLDDEKSNNDELDREEMEDPLEVISGFEDDELEDMSDDELERMYAALEKDVEMKSEGFIKKFESFETSEKIELVDGEKIRECYLQDNYEEIKGSLGLSTMRYKECQSYLDIYVENPEVCKLLVLRGDSGKVRARGLVWTLTDGSKYLDRISYIDKDDESILLQWGEDNGITKSYGPSSATQFKQFVNGVGEVKLQNCEFDEYPYLDTFKYLNCNTGILSDEICVDCYALTETDGSYVIVDEDHNDWVNDQIENRKGYDSNLDFVKSTVGGEELNYKDMSKSEVDDIVNDFLDVKDFESIEKLRTNPDLEWYWNKNESIIFRFMKSFEGFEYDEFDSLDEAKKSGVTASLKKKSKASGIPMGILRKVFSKGMQAWNAGHRPGVAQHQWGMGRVNSFITGAGGARKADADLWTKARAAKARKKKNK